MTQLETKICKLPEEKDITDTIKHSHTTNGQKVLSVLVTYSHKVGVDSDGKKIFGGKIARYVPTKNKGVFRRET